MGAPPKLIQSIERSAAILEIIAQEGGGARLQQIAAIAGIGKTTAHNILQTLTHLGYVQRRPGDMRYHLGGRILNLARIAGDDNILRCRLRPALDSIARKSKATVWLAVPSGDEATYLDILPAPGQPHPAPSGMRQRENWRAPQLGLFFWPLCPAWANVFCPTTSFKWMTPFMPGLRTYAPKDTLWILKPIATACMAWPSRGGTKGK